MSGFIIDELMKQIFYVKSMPESLVLRQTDGDTKQTIITQGLCDILDSGKIIPNTKSFGRDGVRLCTTILDKNYTQTYRPQGIIFTIKNDIVPDYIFPFDLNALTDQNNPIADYGSIDGQLHIHYHVKTIEGFMEFVSNSYEEMVSKFTLQGQEYIDPDNIFIIINEFRVQKGLKPLYESNRKLVEYNEVIFMQPVPIDVIAIYGDLENKYYQQIAQEYGVKHFSNAKQFYDSQK